MKFGLAYFLLAWGLLLLTFGLFITFGEIHLISLLFVLTLLIMIALVGLYYRIGEEK